MLYAFLAMTGTYLLCQNTACLFARYRRCSGIWIKRLSCTGFSAGHVSFLGVTLFPLLLYCYERALDEAQWVILPDSVRLGLRCSEGHLPTACRRTFAAVGVLCSIERRSLRPLALLVLSALVALLSSAIRMLPVLEFVTDHPF